MQAQALCRIRSGVAAFQGARICFDPCCVAKSRVFQHAGTSLKGFFTCQNPGVLSASSRVCRAPLASSRVLSMDSSSKTKTRVVEHIVLLKVKQGVPEQQAETMISALHGLRSLPTVIHLSAGKNSNVVGPDDFTHALHTRYFTKEDLESYANDPLHLEVINKYIAPIVDERIALDWETELDQPTLESSSVGAVRMIAMKPKSASETPSLVELLKSFETRFSSIKQVSVGLNFSSRSKGFEIGCVGLVPNSEELSLLVKSDDYISVHKSSILPVLEKFAVVDYSFA